MLILLYISYKSIHFVFLPAPSPLLSLNFSHLSQTLTTKYSNIGVPICQTSALAAIQRRKREVEMVTTTGAGKLRKIGRYEKRVRLIGVVAEGENLGFCLKEMGNLVVVVLLFTGDRKAANHEGRGERI